MNFLRHISLLVVLFITSYSGWSQNYADTNKIKNYVNGFNEDDHETKINFIDNRSVWNWFKQNIPYFECPDGDIEKNYYFRWWTYRKHIKQTPEGFVITEFLPDVPWAGKYNTISCPAAHHFYEGRWLRNQKYLNDYSIFWFRKGGEPRKYSFWAADAIYNQYLVTRNTSFIKNLLPDLIKNYEGWEKSNLDSNGLYWQIDDRDGMEVSIGGSGYRATINSYLYGDAVAISKMAKTIGNDRIAHIYELKAHAIKRNVIRLLWDDDDHFFKVLPRGKNTTLVKVRELHGYVPWYFNLPDTKFEEAWNQLMQKDGFYAPYGPTSAEQRSRKFMFKDSHECLWNGPSWPFATSQTLTALANLLNKSNQKYVSKEDYYELFLIYTKSHVRRTEDDKMISWIDENLDPYSGEWLARKIMYSENRNDKDRGKDYNHSTYNDLIINGLIGLRPSEGSNFVVNPLVSGEKWDYFCLENVPYHDKLISIIYDKTGKKYGIGKGMRIFVNGKMAAKNINLGKTVIQLK